MILLRLSGEVAGAWQDTISPFLSRETIPSVLVDLLTAPPAFAAGS
jgi:hypothetical protein